MDHLPNEMIYYILYFCDPIPCRFVCRLWRELLCSESVKMKIQNYIETLAEKGYLNLMKWAELNGAPWTGYICVNAALGGHISVLEWIWEMKKWTDLSQSICAAAAQNGHLEVLKWLLSKEILCDEDVFAAAAWGGHIKVMEWLRSEGVSWDKRACSRAAKKGHLEALRWLHSHNAPWDRLVRSWAKQNKDVQMLQWLDENNAPGRK